jgi:hypothetical protein
MGYEPGLYEYLYTLAAVGGYFFIPTLIGVAISQELEKRRNKG